MHFVLYMKHPIHSIEIQNAYLLEIRRETDNFIPVFEVNVLTFQGPYVTLPKFRLPCDGLVAPDHIEIASESRIHFATLLNC